MKQIEAEGGEILLKNSHGDIVIVPKKDRNKIESLVNDGCGECIDSFVETLPVMSNYASDGSLYPEGSKIRIRDEDGKTSYIDIDSPEYREMYSKGQIATRDENNDLFVFPPTVETEIVGETPRWLKLRDKIEKEYTKDRFIDEALPNFSRRMGVSANNLHPNSLDQYNKLLNDKVAKELLSSNPRKGKKFEDNLEWYNSFSPKEREIIQGSNYFKKFRPAERAYEKSQGDKVPFGEMYTSTEKFKESGRGAGESFRLAPNAESNLEDFVNPFLILGQIGQGIANTPQNIKEGNYGQAVIDIGGPLVTGTIGGLGTKNVGQFLNNTFNPLAGTGDLVKKGVNSSGKRYLPKSSSKSNFKSDINLGKEIEVREILPEEMIDLYRIQEKDVKTFSQLASEGKVHKLLNNEKTLARKAEEEKYFGQWFTKDKADLDWYARDREFTNPEIIHLKVPKSKLSEYQNYDKSLSRAPEREFVIPHAEQKLYNVDATKAGNKVLDKTDDVVKTATSSVDDVGKGFKSEIDWGKWNKETPENKALMQEYHAIEQQAKADGTWMKNPDGSDFVGSKPTQKDIIDNPMMSNDMTPEEAVKAQFVQQNSENFKKAFGNNTTITSRADSQDIDIFKSQEDLGREFIKGKYNLDEVTQGHLIDKMWLKESQRLNTGIYSTPYQSYFQNLRHNPNYIIKDLYASMKKPKLTGTGESFHVSKEARDKLLSEGYDSMHTPPSNTYPGEFVVFKPEQLKSAMGNNGMFDMSNPNIYKTILGGALGTQFLKNQQEEPEELTNGGRIKKPKKRLIKAKK